jgi:hypothetical protein
MQVGQCGNQEAHAGQFAPSLRGLTATVQIKPLLSTLFRYISAEQGRRGPMPRFCAAGTGGVATVETFVGAAA